MSDQFNNGNIPRTGAARAVTSRGVPAVSLNLGALTSGVEAPMLNVRAAGAAGMGTAALGEGVSKAGDAIGQLAATQLEHINTRHVIEAESAMSTVKDKIAARWINEPDETKWESIASEEMGAAEGTILHDGLSPDARENISARMVRWRAVTLGESKISSAKRSREKLTESMGAMVIRRSASGDSEGSQAIIGEMERRGLIGADAAERARQQATAKAEEVAKEAMMNTEYDAIRADPRAWQAAHKERGEMDAATHARLWDASQEADRENVAGDVDRLQEAVAGGTIKVPAEVDNFEPDNPRITKEIRERMRVHVAAKAAHTRKAYVEANAPELASKYRSQVKDFDFKKDGEMAYWNLRLAIDELPAPISGEVSGPLEMKFPGRASTVKPEPETTALVEDTLDSMMKRGAFGTYEVPSGKTNDDGEPIMKRDGIAYERALAAKAKAGGQMRRWLQANPGKSPDDAQKRLYEGLDDSTRAGILDLFETPQPSKGSADMGTLDTLPAANGEPVNSLFPVLGPNDNE